jgi:glycosyltransferase involved in cell wall biosynthesis
LECAAASAVTAGADEVLIVDDGTPDRSVVELAARLGVRYVRRPANGGVGAAQNTGIDACTTDALCFLHSDDAMPADRFSDQLPLLADGPIVGGRARYPSGVSVDPWPSATPEGFLRHSFGVHISPYLFRREVLADARFDERLRAWEDWDLMYRLTRDGLRVVPCEAVTVNIGGIEPRLVHSIGMYESLVMLYDEHRAALDRSARCIWAFKIARGARRNRRPAAAASWTLRGIAAEPWHPRRVLKVLSPAGATPSLSR